MTQTTPIIETFLSARKRAKQSELVQLKLNLGASDGNSIPHEVEQGSYHL